MKPGDVVLCDGEQVVIIQFDPGDGWYQVRYPDGDVVWTPPTALHPVPS